MFRFRIATLLLLILTVSVAAGWIVDRRRLRDRIQEFRIQVENHPISSYAEKHAYLSPSNFLVGDTNSYESELVGEIEFSGDMIVSSQGMGQASLRQPDIKTLDQTIALLDSEDPATRLSAARLLALYLEAVSGSGNLDTDSIATRVRFQAIGLHKVRELLDDSDPDIRSASALILGNSLYNRDTVELMKRTFDEEHDGGVKWHLAWAYWKIGHNYDIADHYVKRNQ